MPIIAYQSFNANSSSTHSFSSMSNQRFTKSTNSNAMDTGSDVLQFPTDSQNLNLPIEGPANLVPINPFSSTQHSVSLFGDHLSQVYQHFFRAIGGAPDIMVLGEMDSSHNDFSMMVNGKDLVQTSFANKKACQSFSAIYSGTQVKELTSGVGYVVFSVFGLNVVFVHVPNEFATNLQKMVDFYFGIAKDVHSKGGVIHVVLGDTNQRQVNFTADVMNKTFSVKSYVTASETAVLVDTWPPLETGTNSTGKQMYDVAVYRSDLLDLKKFVYISQSSTSFTVTDHCGMGIHVEPKSTN
jgi:hypothetical protein